MPPDSDTPSRSPLPTKATLKAAAPALAALLAAAAVCTPAFAGGSLPPAVPEIDPGSAVGAVTLLVGGVLTLVDRCRSK